VGELDNTYIVYTSDNGYILGEHRQETKMLPYEESIRVPLMVRGPDVPRGETRSQIAANVDWAPSVADWGGASASAMDGRLLAPVLLGESHANELGWRERLLIEGFGDRSGVPPAFDALRTAGDEMYVEYETGEKELYDLSSGPYELENLLGSSGGGDPGDLPARLDALRDCRAKTCWEAEDGS
jgi:N-acetylglucosamine-6-sulfatase